MNIKILTLYLFLEVICFYSYTQENLIVKQLNENDIELNVDSSDIFELKGDTSFTLYYRFSGLNYYLQGKISSKNIYYNQNQLLTAKKCTKVNNLKNLDTLRLISAISTGARGIEKITFVNKIAYSGVYYDKSLGKKKLPFLLYSSLFKYDCVNNKYLKYSNDSLVEINWIKKSELDEYSLMIVFESKEYIPKEFDEISHIDLWYQRLLLIDYSNYTIVSDEIRSKNYVSYQHSY